MAPTAPNARCVTAAPTRRRSTASVGGVVTPKPMNGDDLLPTTRRRVLRRGATLAGLSVVGSVATSGTAVAGVGEGRVGHYPLNDVEPDGTVPDASPENNDGTVRGDVSVARGDGRVGNALAFDGDGDYVEVPDADSLDVTSEVTVAAWAYLEGDRETKRAIVAKDWDLKNALPYVIDLGTNHANDELSFGFYDGSWHDVTTGSKAPKDEWFHVAGTFEDGELRIYLDGAERNATTVSPSSLPSNDEPLLIGRRTGSGSTRQDFDGLLDEVRVYDRALSADEIDALASMGGGGGNGRGGDRRRGPP